MPILMWAVLVFLALLIWGNLSRKSTCHPLNSVPVASTSFTPTCSLKNTSGDNFASGCAIVSGVGEPTTPLTCHGGILPGICQPLIAHLPVDPPPIAVQKPITGTPVTPTTGTAGWPQPVTVSAPVVAAPAPKPIFPVPVGYHNNVLPAINRNPVLLRLRPSTL